MSAEEEESCSELEKQILHLYFTFCDLAEEQVFYARHSSQEKARFYNNIVDIYSKGIDACIRYFKNEDVLEFIKELEKSGFHKEITHLKGYIEDSTTLNYIREVEREQFRVEMKELFSDNGGIS